MSAGAKSNKTMLIAALVAVVFIVAAAVIAIVSSSGSDPSSSTVPAVSAAPGTVAVTVTGDALPAYSNGDDPAVGRQAPHATGSDLLTGAPLAVGDGPAILVFAAAWCPHCNIELPKIANILRTSPPAGVRIVVVSAWTDPSTANWPSTNWMRNTMKWPAGFDVFSDDQGASMLRAYGVTGFPGFVALDTHGKVVVRGSGEISMDAFNAMIAAVRA